MNTLPDDLEVDLTNESVKAIVRGKTGVPFKTFVKLILQRKVTVLFEKWGQDPIVINSELLTDLASSPQDNQENTQHIIMVTFSMGVFAGFFVFTLLLFIALLLQVRVQLLGVAYMLIAMGAVMALGFVLMRAKQRKKSELFYDTMEKIANIIPKK